MQAHGLACSDPLIGYGELRRYDLSSDKVNSRNGWYVFHDGENPTAVFGY